MAKNLNITINFDLDGTLADLYGVDGWLPMLRAEDETPYVVAEPLIKFCVLARRLKALQRKGYNIAIISWLSMSASEDYNERVTRAKLEWLAKHLPSVVWDRISIVEYGTPKEDYCETELDILFDDDDRVRENWSGVAYDEENILEILKNLLTN